MRENLIRALGYAIMVIVGMVIVELASGNGISFQYVIIAGIIACIVPVKHVHARIMFYWKQYFCFSKKTIYRMFIYFLIL